MTSVIPNSTGGQNAVYRGDGIRLFGMDAEIELKLQAKRDPEVESRLLIWIEEAISEKMKFPNDLIENLKSGIILCKLLNTLMPGTIKNVNTRDTALHHVENISLYIKACWKVGLRSSDLFTSSDLYLRKDVPAVIQNLLAIARAAQSNCPDYKGPKFDLGYKTNTNAQPAKKWDQITFKGPTFVTDTEQSNGNGNGNTSSAPDCYKCGNEKICIGCNPPSLPPVSKVNTILEEKEREKEKQREKEFLLQIQNLSNLLKEKEDGMKSLHDNLEKQRKKNLDDEKLYRETIESQKNQLQSKDNLISTLNKSNSNLVLLTTATSVATTNTTNQSTTIGSTPDTSTTSNTTKSYRNSGVFQSVTAINNKSTASPPVTPSGSTIITSKCTRCNFTTTKTIKYCSSCGELLKKDDGGSAATTTTSVGSAGLKSTTFGKPPIVNSTPNRFSQPVNNVTSTKAPTPTTSTPSSTTSISINNDEKIKTLLTTMKQQEDVISKLNQQITSDKQLYERENKLQKQSIDNLQVILSQKEIDFKKLKEQPTNKSNIESATASKSLITPTSTSSKIGQYLLSAELKGGGSTIEQQPNGKTNTTTASFSRPFGASTQTTTISNREFEILCEKVKTLEHKLNDEISKSKVKDATIQNLNDKLLSFNNRPGKRLLAGASAVVTPNSVKGSQIIVGRKRFNTLKPDSQDLTSLVDKTLSHLTTILYSKPIEFYQVSSLKELFITELGRRRFSQILSMTLKTVPSLLLNDSSFEFLLFLISFALQEMNLASAQDNDIEAAKILFSCSDLLYRINPKTKQPEYLKDFLRSASIFKERKFWEELYWSQLAKRNRKKYGNIPDTLDNEIVCNLLSYFGVNMAYFNVDNITIKNFLTEIAGQHNFNQQQINAILLSVKDSPLYSSIDNSANTNNVVVESTAKSSSKKDKKKK